MTALESILSQEIIQRLGWTLLHFVWQAAAIALLLVILLTALRKASANLRYTISCLALGLIVLLPVVTMQLVGVSVSQPPAVPEPVPAPVVLRTEQVEEIPMAEMPVVEVPAKSKEPRTVPAIPWRQRAVERLEPALPYVVSGWLFGVLALSLWHLGGWTQLQRLRRRMVKPVDASLLAKLDELALKLGIRRAVQLTESALVQIPTVVGWLRPVILLPASALTGLTTEQLEALLAHELAHIRRHDYLVNMLQTIVETLGFYHPAVWWISHRIRTERENCCDDLAVGVSGDLVGYAKALASMEEIRAAWSELAVAASGGNLSRRIRRLVGKDSADNSRTSWIPSVITILLIAAIAGPITLALTTHDRTEHSGGFLLDKMLEHRARVKNLQYVAEFEIWWDPAAREGAIEEIRKRMIDRGTSERQAQRMTRGLSETPEFRYQILKCTLDDTDRRKFEVTTGAYDSSGKRTPARDTMISAWNGVSGTDALQASGSPASASIKDTPPMNATSLAHPWKSFAGALCRLLTETTAAEEQVSVEELKNGTYRVALDYKTGRVVAIVDPSKGYTCALRENYDNQGHLTTRTTAKYEEVAKGIWFPVSGQRQEYGPDGSSRRKSTFETSQIKINDPAFNAGNFDPDLPKGTQVKDHVRGKQYVVGSRNVYDLDESPDSSGATEGVDPNSWREKFYEVYSLKDQEVLKRIVPPFIPERREYFKFVQPGKYSANTPYHLASQFIFSWDEDLNVRNVNMGQGIPRLSTTLESVIGLGSREYDIPLDLANADMSGDWIVSENAPLEEAIEALEGIIKEETGKEMHFVKREVQSEVIIARGKYGLTPLSGAKERDYVHVYTGQIDEFSGAGGGSGTVGKFLRWIGNHRIKMNIIDKTESGDVELAWRNHHSSDLSRLRYNPQLHAERVDMLLNNLARQMGLTFERETAPVEKWFIVDQESSAESVASSPVIAKSPTSPGEDTPIIQVDLRILEVYTHGTLDRETEIAIENLLPTMTISTPREKDGVLTRRYRVSGRSARTGEKLTIKEWIREAAGAARSVGDSSIVTEDPQATQHLRMMVDLLVSRGWVKILMNPTLKVVDGGKAEVSSKQRVPIGKATAPSTQSDRYVDVTDYLGIKPEVLDDGSIMLWADINCQSMSKSEEHTPTRAETSISTQARINPGMSLIMYGNNKPVKNTEIDSDPNAPAEQTPELLFILTPTIVDVAAEQQRGADVQVEDEEPGSAKTAGTKEPTAENIRIVHFPEDRAVGTLKVRFARMDEESDRGLLSLPDWIFLDREAQGDVNVHAGVELRLEVSGDVTDLSFLSDLEPNDLQVLMLSNMNISDEELVHLKGLTGLLGLNLGSTAIEGDGLVHLAPLESLRRLSLFNTQVSDAGLAHLSALRSLKYLNLCMTRVRGPGLKHLKSLTSLASLDLAATPITDEYLAHLEELPWLKELQIYDTDITDKGLAHLKPLRSLESLILGKGRLRHDCSPITDEGLVHLKELHSLKDLHLLRTRVTDAGLAHLSTLTKLEALDLKETQITGEGLAFLKDLPALTYLNLKQTGVGRAGLAHLKSMTRLKRLELGKASISRADLKDLENALPKCTVNAKRGSISITPATVESPVSSGEEKRQILVDCRVLEIYPMRFDRETTIAAENILGETVTSRAGRDGVPTRSDRTSGKSAPTFEEWIREVEGPSIVIRDGQTTQKIVDLLVSRGYVKVLMNPTLEVMDGGKGRVSSTQRVPMGKATTPSTQSDRYVDVIDYFEITPHILDNNRIELLTEGINTQVLKQDKGQPPIFTKSSFSGNVAVGRGMSLIMGGTQEIDGGAEASERPETKVLFIFTPTIVDTDEPADETDQEQEESKIEGETQQTDKIVYPRNWREIVGKRARQVEDPIAQDREDAQVHRRLETIVDLLGLSAGMSFDDVVGELEAAVDPPLEIQPNWRDLREAAGIEPTTPVGMKPLTDVKLGKALEILLAGVSSESAKVRHVVDRGVVIIATPKALPRNMVTRVYDITDLLGDPDDHGGMSRVMQAHNLANFIRERVDSESWYDLDIEGEGTITPYPMQEPKKLAVYNTLKAHRGIQRLLEKVRSGAEHVPAEFPRQMTILGRCVDSAGRPLSDTRVLVFSVDDTAALVAESRTNLRGQFRLGPVASLTEEDTDTGRRRYLIFVPADGHGPAWKRIYKYEQTVSWMELKTYESAEVSGTIVTENSKPVAGAQVWVRLIVPPGATTDLQSSANNFFTPAPLPGWSTTTDGDGAFRIAGVPDGARIQLFVSHGDFAGSLTYVKPGKDVSISVQPAAVVTGRVLYGKSGQPAAGVEVQAQGVEDVSIPGGKIASWGQTVTDAEGRYELRSLGGSRYNIWAQAEDLTVVALDSFKLETGQTHQIRDLLLVEGGFIAGRVINEATGEPIKPGAASDVAIYGPSRPKSGAAVECSRIGEDGSFRIRVAPGRNYIYLRARENWRTQETMFKPPSRWVNVAAGQTVEVEFKIRKYSQAELDEAKNHGPRFSSRLTIPKTIDEVEAEYEFQRMSRLASAIALYVREHDRALPNTLLELKPYLPNKDDLSWALDDVEYLLRGKKLMPPNAVRRPIAYDAALLAKGAETYAVFADFTVRRIDRRELEQLGVYFRPGRGAAMTDRWAALYTAMKMYAKEHDGKLPDTVDALKPHIVSERYFEWISSKLKCLAPGRHLGLMQSWAPIACEKEQFENDQFTAVLFSDGHTESIYPKQIKKLAQLDRQVKQSAEWLMCFGRAMLAYANDHDGRYPDSPHHFQEYLKAERFSWPMGIFEYMAKGKTTSDPPDVVTAYDIELLQQGKGTNVLFNDSHVEFVRPERLRQWNISNAKILLKTQILTATDDFLESIGLDANSVRTSEIWSEHLLADSATEPNSQPYRLILDELNVNLLLKTIQAHEGGKRLAAPQVMAMVGKEAMMRIVTGEYSFLSPHEPNDTSGKTKPKPKTIEVGTSLRLVPNLMADNDNVHLDLEWELRQLRGFKQRAGPDKKKHKFPLIAVDNVKTTVVIPEGKTLLIGGKKLTWYVESERGVPILSELPAIGKAFRTSGVTAEPRTLLIMVKTTVNPKTAPPPLDPDDPFAKKLREKFERAN